MNKINLEELTDYQIDEEGSQNFQRPYFIPSLSGFIIAIAGFILLIGQMDSNHYHHGGKTSLLATFWRYFARTAQQVGIGAHARGYLPIGFFVGGIILFLATMFCMARATPTSSLSKMKMEKYWNANPAPGCTEIVYVDRSSKTYFKRVFASRRTRWRF